MVIDALYICSDVVFTVAFGFCRLHYCYINSVCNKNSLIVVPSLFKRNQQPWYITKYTFMLFNFSYFSTIYYVVYFDLSVLTDKVQINNSYFAILFSNHLIKYLVKRDTFISILKKIKICFMFLNIIIHTGRQLATNDVHLQPRVIAVMLLQKLL